MDDRFVNLGEYKAGCALQKHHMTPLNYKTWNVELKKRLLELSAFAIKQTF